MLRLYILVLRPGLHRLCVCSPKVGPIIKDYGCDELRVFLFRLVSNCNEENLLEAVIAYEEVLVTDTTPMWSDETLSRLANRCTVLNLAGARMLLVDQAGVRLGHWVVFG